MITIILLTLFLLLLIVDDMVKEKDILNEIYFFIGVITGITVTAIILLLYKIAVSIHHLFYSIFAF